MKQKDAYEHLCREYFGKCEGCDECVAECFCIVEGLKYGREPAEDCIKNIQQYYRQKR